MFQNPPPNQITLRKLNESFVKVFAERSICMELSEEFSFRVPGFQFMPAYKNKMWDGKIRLFNINNQQIYFGLVEQILTFASKNNYSVVFENFVYPPSAPITYSQSEEFYKTLNLPVVPYDFQIQGLTEALNRRRSILLSATASGKSLLLYAIIRRLPLKTLLIVPTVSLVEQMVSDFNSYSKNDDSFDAYSSCHRIYNGSPDSYEKYTTDKQVTVSTWQSLVKMKQSFFEQYQLVINDEVHTAQGKSITSILEKCVNAKFRVGVSGTIQDAKCDKMVLEGLFGPVLRISSVKDLMDRKIVADLSIRCITLKYPPEICKAASKADYVSEMKYIVNNEHRNKFLRNLALSLKGNTLLLTPLVEKHGKVLNQLFQDKLQETGSSRKLFYVYGKTGPEEREEIRRIIETEKDAIIIATLRIFSTGINIKNLDNLIFGLPWKAKITSLQSIGRILRKGENQPGATLYDIVDDMSHGEHKNFAMDHFLERLSIYDSEQLNYKFSPPINFLTHIGELKTDVPSKSSKTDKRRKHTRIY